jgi:hypothetical protein
VAAVLSGVGQAVEEAQYAEVPEDQRPEYKAECESVKKLWTAYETARTFDKEARSQYAIDRRYASGTADQSWVVNTNLIGSYIDILTSFLYARNPDVSVKKAPQVLPSGTKSQEEFARTCELVISHLWKKGNLAKLAKRMVRSSLSCGPGWLKVIMLAEPGREAPQMQTELNDIQDNIKRLEACKLDYASPEGQAKSPEEQAAEMAHLQELETSILQKIEVSIRKGLAIDFVSAENMQVSLDVAAIEDHLDASWNANAIFRPKSKLKELFPRLTDEDVKSAKAYYQKKSAMARTAMTDRVNLGGDGGQYSDDAEQYTTATGAGTVGDEQVEFAKIIEVWDKDTGHIKTMIEGVKRWPKEPFQPAYASTRFYPYFYLAFYECDGERHPQSLSWRLAKLQDEYARSRSNFRLTRERSIPGTLFNSAGISAEDVRKIERGVHQEMIGITPTGTDQKLSDMFAEKPTASVDMRLFDNTPILQDMEKIAGVQEALQASVSTPKTATEANIQQSGFASRTTADRDTLEGVLNQLAQYTAELAIGALTQKDVIRICGPGAFWPYGMDIEDLLTLAEVEIQAGTTGKPRAEQDQQAWGVILPQIKEAIEQYQIAMQTQNVPLAMAIKELVRETMVRFGDDTDIDRFFPAPPPLPAAPGAIPGQPPLPGDPAGGGPPGAVAPEPPLGDIMAPPPSPEEVSGAPPL